MQIKTSQLSKESLVAIVDAAREAGVVGDGMITNYYKYDLISDLVATGKQLTAIEEKLKKRMSGSKHVQLAKRRVQLINRYHRKHKEAKPFLPKEDENAPK